MNVVIVTGTVMAEPDDVRTHEDFNIVVRNFKLSLDSRQGRRPTEVWVSLWSELAVLADLLSPGDRIAVTGALSHMFARGVVIVARAVEKVGKIDLAGSEEHTDRDN